MFRKLALTFACLLALFVPAAARKRDKNPVFGQINSIVASLAKISGLTEEHPVPYASITKRQLRRFLGKRIKKSLKADEVEADELALKMFGLVPDNFNLRKSTVDLLTEQAAAFYDYDQKKLFLLQGAPLPEETTTLAHELSHALADQHFNLGKYMDEDSSNDDENLAHTAVVEGQATWLMMAYDLAAEGKPLEPTADMLRAEEGSDDLSGNDYPVLKSSPLYIQQSLLFPYSKGTRFFDAVYRRMGRPAFSAVFLDPPYCSGEIMHPERYFHHTKPVLPSLPKWNLGSSQTEITQGVLGEFDEHVLLWQYVGQAEADRLAPHFRGGRFRVTAKRDGEQPVLEYVASWDSPAYAADYFAQYKKILARKWKRCVPLSNNDSAFTGLGDRGYFVTHLQGDTLTSVEGLAEPAVRASLKTPPSALRPYPRPV